MGDLQVKGDELVLHLSAAEKVEGMHGDLRVPLSAVRSVEVLQDAHEPADHGIKLGTRMSGVIEVGTMAGESKIFAAVHRDTPRGVRVVLDGSSYDEWIVGCADPETLAQEISGHVRR
jgi:hypothetical protein